MNHKSFPEPVYTAALEKLNGQLRLLKKRKETIAWLRFAVILLLTATLYYGYPLSTLYTFLTALGIDGPVYPPG